MSVGEATTGTAAEPLRGGATTGIDNHLRVAPYEVTRVHVPRRWDPTSETLAVGYDINNPNHRAVRGQILYLAPGTFDPRPEGPPPGQPVVVHRQQLSAAQVRPACHEVPPGQQWDGTITEGLPDRIGEKVTADLAPIVVRVEIWNRPTPRPGNRAGSSSGTTDVPGEYLARNRARTELDVIAEARWDRRRVIPYDDPDEPQFGFAKMIIRVRNVAEGTPVRLFIYRIMDIADPFSDMEYTYTGLAPDEQPGLENAIVRNGRVVLPDGSEPEVRFNVYGEHWVYPGNNFYCFRVAFGDRGRGVVASERDYVNKERDCLHMRFTVFIHRSAGDLPEYTRWANQLHQFFRNNTKYFRSYIMTGSPRNAEDWRKHFRHRYIVILFGHAACGCRHDTHPRQGGRADGRFLDPYHSGFAPDQNVCPTSIVDTAENRRQLREDRRHYGHDFGGCGNKSHVFHQNTLGRVTPRGARQRQQLTLANIAPPNDRDDLLVWPNADGSSSWLNLFSITPRLFFWNGGCRTMLTTNMGERFVDNGTTYYHGWIYSPACDYGKMAYDVFYRWIKGTSANPAPDEYDVGRLVPAYRDAATKGTRPRYYPRVMDQEHGTLNPAAAPDAAEGAMR